MKKYVILSIERGNVRNQDRVQQVLEINKENTLLWNSVSSVERSLLWLRFIGSVSWPNGYWVHHPLTSYLDVQMLDEGRMILTRDGHETVITGPTLVIIPPGEHKLAADITGVCRKRHLGIQGAIVINNLAKMNLDKVHILPGFQNQAFDELFNSLLQMMREKNSEKISDVSVLAYEMLLLLSHCTEQQPFPEELAWAVHFIHRDFASIGSLADICLYCNRAKSTLQGLFKHYMNTTPMQYLTEVRMNHAAKQLRNTLMSIKEIAEICGYSDQLYFSSAFKKHFHCSPRAYRKAAGVSEPEKTE